MKLSTRILLGLSLGLATGILHSGLDGQLLNSLPVFIEPIGSLWVNAIRMTVVPLIMALLVTSIASQHEGGMLAKLGARTMGLFGVLIAGVCLYTLMFASPIARTTGTYFIAILYGIELGPAELVIIALAIGLLSFYSPGIPSGGLLIMSPVHISLGLPVEGIGILIAVDLIVDMFLTAANVTANVAATVLLTRDDRLPAD